MGAVVIEAALSILFVVAAIASFTSLASDALRARRKYRRIIQNMRAGE